MVRIFIPLYKNGHGTEKAFCEISKTFSCGPVRSEILKHVENPKTCISPIMCFTRPFQLLLVKETYFEIILFVALSFPHRPNKSHRQTIQNRRQKVFNRDLHACAGGVCILTFDRLVIIVFCIPIWRVLEICQTYSMFFIGSSHVATARSKLRQ